MKTADTVESAATKLKEIVFRQADKNHLMGTSDLGKSKLCDFRFERAMAPKAADVGAAPWKHLACYSVPYIQLRSIP